MIVVKSRNAFGCLLSCKEVNRKLEDKVFWKAYFKKKYKSGFIPPKYERLSWKEKLKKKMTIDKYGSIYEEVTIFDKLRKEAKKRSFTIHSGIPLFDFSFCFLFLEDQLVFFESNAFQICKNDVFLEVKAVDLTQNCFVMKEKKRFRVPTIKTKKSQTLEIETLRLAKYTVSVVDVHDYIDVEYFLYGSLDWCLSMEIPWNSFGEELIGAWKSKGDKKLMLDVVTASRHYDDRFFFKERFFLQ